MTQSTNAGRRGRTAAWLGLLALAALLALPALHVAPRSSAGVASEVADAPQSLAASQPIRSHLSCPVCLALAQARSLAVDAAVSSLILSAVAPFFGDGAAPTLLAAPDRDDQRPRAPPLPA
jgi:hypothetical protein